MGKEFYNKYDLVKKLFGEADEVLKFPLSKIILEGPKEELDLTPNTQPAIFLISYSIFRIIKEELYFECLFQFKTDFKVLYCNKSTVYHFNNPFLKQWETLFWDLLDVYLYNT